MANITITVPAGNPIETAKREEILKSVAKLPMDDLERLGKLATNKKALTGLKQHWNTLLSMFG